LPYHQNRIAAITATAMATTETTTVTASMFDTTLTS
jgi:hypothetical protein